mgnify:FL=1
MESKRLLKIPSQIRLKTEFFEGFSTQELIKTIICGVIASVIAYIIYLIFKQALTSTLIVIGTIVISVIFFTKNRNNFSMSDSIKNILRFQTMQREYKYVGGDFYNKKVVK